MKNEIRDRPQINPAREFWLEYGDEGLYLMARAKATTGLKSVGDKRVLAVFKDDTAEYFTAGHDLLGLKPSLDKPV